MISQRRTRALRSLLSTLAVGGDAPIVTLEDWEIHLQRYLHPRPSMGVMRWFWCALQAEWLPAEPPNTLCAEVADHVEGYLTGRGRRWANVWGHILRVTGAAVTLARRRGIDPRPVFLTAILHDVRKLDESGADGYHEELGADYAAHVLKGRVPHSALETIVEAIAIHPDRPPGSWEVARALHDADKLDKVGAAGLLRRVSAGEDLEEACEGAYRVLDDAEYMPILCFEETQALLQPRMRFVETLTPLLDDLCDTYDLLP